ncbi:MAG: glycosyltransferase [Solirubrobacterales bacterium]
MGNDSPQHRKVPILYLGPWIDYGGTDKNTIDWFRGLDRERFSASLITTQPSENRRLREIEDFVDETWILPDLMPAEDMPAFILDFIVSRQIEVVHLMNARLGFDLLPDITCLPQAPGIVVQLHVEEADRSGYVRYVTTRYGNLVDRFSVTSHHLDRAVQDYGIPADRTKVIYIGVDAEEEFDPDQVEPVEGLAEDCFHILFPARIVPQKDPLLMVEVAAALRDRGIRFQVHILGEGELEDAVRSHVAALDLGEQILIHPPTATPQRWYAASDAVLLTSEFEGVPAVVYEAMAMGLPVVASALPGNVELLGETYDGLIQPRDSVEAYVEALAMLAEDRSYKESHGRELRERALERFTLAQMAAGHAELYEEVRRRPEVEAGGASGDVAPEPLRFRDRSLFGEELVSVLVPHYNQARFLGDCIDAIWAQTYPNVELVVVDDCSTETDAAAVLDELEGHDDVTVVRLDRNGGPSRARNIGLEHCSGRYVLPVDSDNLLLPEAIATLVEQLSTAGEEVGFIYPNLQFFGNREDYFEPPEFNLYTLLHGNYCDTCSLIDRAVFDAGLRYREEIVLGHEDWEFVLRLAAHGVRGEACHSPTLLYRKWGFNRSDAVDHAPTPFDEVLKEISPFVGEEERIKSEESPALSIAVLSPLVAGAGRQRVAERLAAQSCKDVELIAPCDDEFPVAAAVPPLRRLPTGVAADPLAALRRARGLMRGRFAAVGDDPGLGILADPAFVEKVLRRFAVTGEHPDAIAFADLGEAARYGFRSLSEEELSAGPRAHAIVWATACEERLPWGLHIDPDQPAHSIARLLSGAGARVEWRHAPMEGESRGSAAEPSWSEAGPLGQAAEAGADVIPLLPGKDRYTVPRWEHTMTWAPPLTTVLVRYKHRLTEHRVITNRPPPFGYAPEHYLGALRSTAFEGTERLLRVGDDFVTRPRGEWQQPPPDGEELGYLEQAPLPLFNCLGLGVHRATRQRILVSMPDDPLMDEVDLIEALGFIEPFPIKPGYEPQAPLPLGLVGLAKSVDQEARRHRYAVGSLPDGELVGELGALAESELQGSIGAWIVDGRLVTDRHAPPAGKSTAARATRWVLEPAAWQGLASSQARAKTALRRSSIAATKLVKAPPPPPQPAGRPAGWLFEADLPGLSPLYAAYHPVTGDQLLTRSPQDGPQMGYEGTVLLGFVRLAAPLTGDLDQRAFPVPWARRFGAVPRLG